MAYLDEKHSSILRMKKEMDLLISLALTQNMLTIATFCRKNQDGISCLIKTVHKHFILAPYFSFLL